MALNYTKKILPSGMRVILIPQKESVAATVLVMVEAGSKYETKEINGISHFLEHLCFKGTTQRPTAMAISGELDGMGAEYNAFTSQEWTGYFAKVEAHKVEKALDLISDLYLNPVFNPAEIEKEKGVVIEEMHMYEDLPPRRVHDFFMELLYGDQPAGWKIDGKKEVIQKVTREEVVSYRKAHYVPAATVIVIAGAFNEKKIFAEIKQRFGTMKDGKKSGKVPTKEQQKKPAVLVKHKESDQTHLVLGCRAFDMYDKRRYALEIFSDVLGGGMSSRLFQRVREELGAAYYVKASADLFTDHGFLSVAVGAEHGKLFPVIDAILKELKNHRDVAISKEELQRAKDHLAGRLLLGLETSDSLATYYGGQEIVHAPLETPEELLKQVYAVTSKDVQNVAKFLVKNEKLNCALIGPLKDEAKLKKALHF